MFVPVPVVHHFPETDEMCVLRLDLARSPHAGAYTTPGQYLRARVAGGEAAFALASAPGADQRVEILVKRGAAVADALCAARAGDTVAVSRPAGKGFPVAAARGRTLLLIAAGSGIGPLRAVVQWVLARRAEYGEVTLLHGQRGSPDFAFAREHDAWELGGVRVVQVCSRPSAGFQGHTGYVQDALRALRPDLHHTEAFLSGMRGMIDGVIAVLRELGLPRERIHLNY